MNEQQAPSLDWSQAEYLGPAPDASAQATPPSLDWSKAEYLGPNQDTEKPADSSAPDWSKAEYLGPAGDDKPTAPDPGAPIDYKSLASSIGQKALELSPISALGEAAKWVRQAPPKQPDTRPEQDTLTTAPPPDAFERAKTATQSFFGTTPQQMPAEDIAKAQLALEAREPSARPTEDLREQPPMAREDYLDQAGTADGRLARQNPVGNIATGMKSTAQSLIESGAWLTDNSFLKGLSNAMGEDIRANAPEKPNLAAELEQGIGSSVAFFVPGMGVAGMARAASSIAPAAASWLGVGVSTVIEAMSEAGSARRDMIEKGSSPEQADNAATKTFWLNIPTLAVTNKLGGLFEGGEGGSLVSKMLRAAPAEGVQESAQEMASATAKGEDMDWRQVGKAGAIGAATGGIFAGAGHVINSQGAAQPGKAAGAPVQVPDFIRRAAELVGEDPEYLTRNMLAESGGRDVRAKQNGSEATTASGLFQFTDGTWRAMVSRYGQDYGLTLDGRSDPNQQAIAAALFTKDNRQALRQSLGRDPSDGEVYMAAFLGQGGARQFLPALAESPNDAAANHVSPAAVRANQSIFYGKDGQPRTLQQVYDMMAGKVQGGGSSATAPVSGEAPSRPAVTKDRPLDLLSQQYTDDGVAQARTGQRRTGETADLLQPESQAPLEDFTLDQGTTPAAAPARTNSQPAEMPIIRPTPASQEADIPARPAAPQPTGNAQAVPVQPEPQAYIDAQVAAMADPRSTKWAVLVTPGSPEPTQVPAGVTRFRTKHGLIYTTDKTLRQRVPWNASDAVIGREVLGYDLGRPAPGQGVAVRAMDQRGTPVAEVQVDQPGNLPAAQAAMVAQSPVNRTDVVPLGQAMADRQAGIAQDLGADLAGKSHKELLSIAKGYGLKPGLYKAGRLKDFIVQERAKEAGVEPFYQRTYQGSPTRGIERMSDEYLGTGEGGRSETNNDYSGAYGYGHYSAQNRATGEWYRQNLSKGEPVLIGDERFEKTNEGWVHEESGLTMERNSPEAIALDAYRNEQGKAGLRERLNEIKEDGENFRGEAEATRQALKSYDSIEEGKAGQLYQLEVPDSDKLLDWDKPLSEQPAGVRERLVKNWVSHPSLDQTGAQIYAALENDKGSAKAASQYLDSIGIPGHQYLDGSSRSQGEGSRNVVVYSDKNVDITGTFYKQGSQRGRPLDPEVSQAIVDAIREKFPEANLVLARTPNDLHPFTRHAIAFGDASAVYIDGRSTIYAPKMRSEADVFGSAMHELAHQGIDNLRTVAAERLGNGVAVGRESVNNVLDIAWASRAKDIRELAAKGAPYEGQFDLTTKAGRRRLTEEWMAKQAETPGSRWYDRYVAAMTKFFRSVADSMGLKVRWTDAETRNFLRQAFDTMRGNQQGASAGEMAPAFARQTEGKPAAFQRQETATLGREDVASTNPEVQKRLDAARGLAQPSLQSKIKAKAADVIRSFTRAFPLLDSKTDGRYIDIFRRVSAIPEASAKKATDLIFETLKGLRGKPNEYAAFTMNLVLEDMNKDIEGGLLDPSKGLPFGYTPESFQADLEKFRGLAASNKDVAQALEKRAMVTGEIRHRLVELGLLPEEVLLDDNYFRHQVLQYMAAKQFPGTGSGDVRTHKKGWQRGRSGSVLDYNTQYVEAEFEWMAQALSQISMKEHLAEIRREGDVMPQAREQAKAWNRVHPEAKRTWKDFIPEGYRAWKPAPGSAWYKGATVADRIIEGLLEGSHELQESEVKTALMRGQDETWLLPAHVAETMDRFRPPPDEAAIGKALRAFQTKWKQWTLLNPLRVVKYNINNTSGDVDIAMAYDYKILGGAVRAAKDLRTAAAATNVPPRLRQEMDDARRYGVIGSSLSIQEIPDIAGELEMDKRLDLFLDAKPGMVAKFWRSTKDFTTWRENILRLASYRYFKNKLAAADKAGTRIYGASKRSEVDALWPTEEERGDRVAWDKLAAKLARELMGDYGKVSHAGQWLRAHAFPFWSWAEVNAPRYVNLLRNLSHEGQAEDRAGQTKRIVGAVASKTAITTAKTAVGSFALSALIQLYNGLFWPDEEDELGTQGRRQLHLILGRNDDGTIRTLRLQGALSDALSWGGLDDYAEKYRQLKEGKTSWADIAKDMGLAAPTKLLGMVSPLFKTPAELLMGKSLYPDPSRPKPIRDKVEYIARTFSLGDLYNWATGKPMRGGGNVAAVIGNVLANSVTYSSDPGEAAYWDTKALVSKWREAKGQDEASGMNPTDKGNALYYYKQAMKYGDLPAAQKYLQEYVNLGGDLKKGILTSLERSAPLAGIKSGTDREAFLKSLGAEDRNRLKLADAWFQRTYLTDDQKGELEYRAISREARAETKTFKDLRKAGDREGAREFAASHDVTGQGGQLQWQARYARPVIRMNEKLRKVETRMQREPGNPMLERRKAQLEARIQDTKARGTQAASGRGWGWPSENTEEE